MKIAPFLYLACMFLGTRIVGQKNGVFQCPERRGFFPNEEQCDAYFACVDGDVEERLCKDGLVFKDDNPKKELCDIPANVPCGERKLLQAPQPSEDCPRRNGYFKHADPTQCDKFVNCIDGVAQIMSCPPGLIYDEANNMSCVWPVDTDIVCSDVKREILDDGFSCPRGRVQDAFGRVLPHPTYAHPDDCAKFYICRNGLQPQHGQCVNGTVYNEQLFKCMDPEDVPGCENYFKST